MKLSLLGLCSLLCTTLCGSNILAQSEKPNIILLLSDDQHWDGLSVAMHPNEKGSKSSFYRTPFLEKFASQGMRFSAAYAPAPVCAPTRISLQTGKSPAALRWCKASPTIKASLGTKLLPASKASSIKAEEITIGEALQKAGYQTAHYGKWHLSGGGPEKHGYHASDGDVGNEQAGKFKDTNPVDIVGMTDRAIKFIDQNKQNKKPFFIQMSYNALHAPQNASQKNIDKFTELMDGYSTRQIQRAALTADLDEGVERLVNYIDKAGIRKNTYIIYMSDNGAAGTRTGAIGGGKGSLSEGGIRVPFIIAGPNIKPNSWCNQSIVGFDLYPTFCDLAATKPTQKGLEGVSISALFKNPSASIKRDHPITFHFPHYQTAPPSSAIIDENYKLIYDYESKSSKLFDLTKDMGEKTDLSMQHAELAKKMEKKLFEHLVKVNAELPKANPNYDPSKPDPEYNTRGKRGNRRGGKNQRGKRSNQ